MNFAVTSTGGLTTVTPNMVIAATGNVGIGTTSPNVSLDLTQKTDAVALPSGTSSQRPTAGVANGDIRYSQSLNAVEAYINGAWDTLLTSAGSTSGVNLGTAASATNPSRTAELGTGLFSAASGQVSVAVSEAGTGTEVGRWTSTGLNIIAPVTASADEPSLQINGNNAVWQDAPNLNLAVGPTAMPTTISQAGGAPHGLADTAVGIQALNANTTGALNTAVGETALAVNTTGWLNTAVGQAALAANTTGSGNVAVGQGALANNTTGSWNEALGQSALGDNTTGSYNVAMGESALAVNTTGGYNTAVGQSAMSGNITGSYNVAVGEYALAGNTTGGHNTTVGTGALQANTAGTNNTVLGNSVANGTLTTGSYNILIGTSGAVTTVASGTNYNLNIGNLLQGDMTYSTGLGTEALYLQSTSGSVDYLQMAVAPRAIRAW